MIENARCVVAIVAYDGVRHGHVADNGERRKCVPRDIGLDAAPSTAIDILAQLVADLVNYMTYMSEPARDDRITVGLYALIVISILIALTYALKKEFWKDVH